MNEQAAVAILSKKMKELLGEDIDLGSNLKLSDASLFVQALASMRVAQHIGHLAANLSNPLPPLAAGFQVNETAASVGLGAPEPDDPEED